jgi:L-fuculose-phosphate aldolase
MHLALYAARPDIGAIVHAHPPTATGFAVAGIPLADCVLPEVVATLGTVPIAAYATPASEELGASVARVARTGHDGMLLKNHGAVAIGADLESALDRLETIEQFARVVLTARLLGRVETLAPADVSRLLGMAHRPGEPGKPWQCGACGACRACQGGAAGGASSSAAAAGGADAASDHLVTHVAELVRRRLNRES